MSCPAFFSWNNLWNKCGHKLLLAMNSNCRAFKGEHIGFERTHRGWHAHWGKWKEATDCVCEVSVDMGFCNHVEPLEQWSITYRLHILDPWTTNCNALTSNAWPLINAPFFSVKDVKKKKYNSGTHWNAGLLMPHTRPYLIYRCPWISHEPLASTFLCIEVCERPV